MHGYISFCLHIVCIIIITVTVTVYYYYSMKADSTIMFNIEGRAFTRVYR